MIGTSLSTPDLCIVVVLSVSLMAIAYLPIALVTYAVLSTHQKAGITNPWRHWVQFNIRELLLLVLTLSIILACRNLTISVIATATLISHAAGKRAAVNAPPGLARELYCFFFSGVFGWVTFGAHGASSHYHHAATRWEIFSRGSWQDSFSVVLADFINFMAHGLWGFIPGAMFVALSLALHWTLSYLAERPKTLKAPHHTP